MTTLLTNPTLARWTPTWPDLSGVWDPAVLVAGSVRAVLIFAAALLAVRVLHLATDRLATRESRGEDFRTRRLKEQRMQTVSSLLRSAGTVVLLAVATLMALDAFVDTGPLLAMAGVLGLAFSFGAQSLVKDVINGAFILMEGQYAIGDVITVNGTSGLVETITLRATVLRDLHGVVHTIPNGKVETVSNRTKVWSRALLDVSVAYSTDIDRAIALLADIGREMRGEPVWAPMMMEDPEVLGVNKLAESAVEIRLIAKTIPLKQWEVERELRRRIKNRFDAEGVTIPFPQRTVHMAPAS